MPKLMQQEMTPLTGALRSSSQVIYKLVLDTFLKVTPSRYHSPLCVSSPSQATELDIWRQEEATVPVVTSTKTT